MYCHHTPSLISIKEYMVMTHLQNIRGIVTCWNEQMKNQYHYTYILLTSNYTELLTSLNFY